MNTVTFLRSSLALVCLGSSLGAFGQSAGAASKGEPDNRASNNFSAAIQLRNELTASLASAEIAPEDALKQLRHSDAPMGLGLGSEAEFALAAIDLGQRLVAMHKADKAILFFREAEDALGRVIESTPKESAVTKAMLLGSRAFVRNKFLNKTPDADSDLAEAILLQPDDKHLRRQREEIPDAKAGRLKTSKK